MPCQPFIANVDDKASHHNALIWSGAYVLGGQGYSDFLKHLHAQPGPLQQFFDRELDVVDDAGENKRKRRVSGVGHRLHPVIGPPDRETAQGLFPPFFGNLFERPKIGFERNRLHGRILIWIDFLQAY